MFCRPVVSASTACAARRTPLVSRGRRQRNHQEQLGGGRWGQLARTLKTGHSASGSLIAISAVSITWPTRNMSAAEDSLGGLWQPQYLVCEPPWALVGARHFLLLCTKGDTRVALDHFVTAKCRPPYRNTPAFPEMPASRGDLPCQHLTSHRQHGPHMTRYPAVPTSPCPPVPSIPLVRSRQ